jgi:hypothetical protein
MAGGKGAAFASLLYWCLRYRIISKRAIETVIEQHHRADKLRYSLDMVNELLRDQTD